MTKNKKEELTDVQIKVDTEKRIKAIDEEIGKLCEKFQVVLVPVLDYQPTQVKPVIKIVSTKKYEQKEQTQSSKK